MTRNGEHAELSYNAIMARLNFRCHELVKMRGHKLCETEDYKRAIRGVAEVLCSESPRYGLMLCGQCGNGKTTLLRALSHLVSDFILSGTQIDTMCVFTYVTAQDIVDAYENNRDKYNELKWRRHLIIDELGSETPEIDSYGTKFQPLKELLFARYTDMLFTAVGTNVSIDGIAERYGDSRLADRLHEMYDETTITMTEESYR